MFARTERLMLRPGWPEDADALARAIAHEDVAMRLARLPWPYSIEDAQAWLATPRSGTDPTSLLITSVESVEPKLVGGIGLVRLDDGSHELGYWLTPTAWGRGYATEAGRAMIDIARHTLRLRRLASGHFVDNPASGRVLKKLGFCETGRARRPCLARGHDVDSVEMALDLSDDLPAMQLAA
jgi:RimJ/RimL family protein N-acetyltransferase